jgi:cytochrome c oxidase cbb3-type subunit 2
VTRAWLLIIGASGTIGFALLMLVIVPQIMLVRVEPPAELQPYSPSQLNGRRVYIANGCLYCHSQQIRDEAFTTDVARGWGSRATVPADYIYDQPHLLGTMRTGPDLINVGNRLPDPDWQLIHLYDPRAVVSWSIMPAFPYLFQEKDSAAVTPQDRLVPVRGPRAPRGKAVVATQDALDLVDYLLSLKREYPVQPAQGHTGTESAENSTPPAGGPAQPASPGSTP